MRNTSRSVARFTPDAVLQRLQRRAFVPGLPANATDMFNRDSIGSLSWALQRALEHDLLSVDRWRLPLRRRALRGRFSVDPGRPLPLLSLEEALRHVQPHASPVVLRSKGPDVSLGRTPRDLDMHTQRTSLLVIASVFMMGLLALSGCRPYDRATWAMEVAPVAIALPILWATYRRFPLTNLLYVCIAVHAMVLMLGGAYTYARVPLGFQIQEVLGLQRNPYDKIGHFFQGFVPALVAREILIRGDHLRGRRLLAFVVVCIVLAISATYELVEWSAALALGQGADEFLGTQGDPWDTQSDMFLALIGAIAALLLLSRVHDRQIDRLENLEAA